MSLITLGTSARLTSLRALTSDDNNWVLPLHWFIQYYSPRWYVTFDFQNAHHKVLCAYVHNESPPMVYNADQV